MLARSLEALTPDDISALVSNGVPESRHLDYKQTLPGGSDDDKKEFLADVAAFANTAGGDILFGISEAQGLPEAVSGVVVGNRDAEQLRLEGIVRDGLDPRLPKSVEFRWMEIEDGKAVLILRVPRSWMSPHMVKFRQWSRFFARTSAGKFQLDATQLRQAFLENGALSDRARAFRAERVGAIASEDTPIALSSPQRVCLHVVPHSALSGGPDVELNRLWAHTDLVPLYSESRGFRYNLEGLLAFANDQGGRAMSYLQVFRNGILETVSSELTVETRTGARIMFDAVLGRELFQFLRRAAALLDVLDVEVPVSIYLSFVGMPNVTIAYDQGFIREVPQPFRRDIVLFRELTLTEWTSDPARQLMPLMNEVNQAAGLSASRSYDPEGRWRPPY